jgi:ribonuclease E
MTRFKKLFLGAAGAAAVAAAVTAVRNMRAAPFPGAVPPPPPSRPPQRPPVDEAPRPASEPARPQVSEQRSPESEPQAPVPPTPIVKTPENPAGGSEVPAALSETNYLEMNREQLYAEARRRNLRGRSMMTREQLARALAES